MYEVPMPKSASRSAKFVCIHHYGYRTNVPADILGIRMVEILTVTPNEERPCFMLLYPDGMIDYFPVADTDNYKII